MPRLVTVQSPKAGRAAAPSNNTTANRARPLRGESFMAGRNVLANHSTRRRAAAAGFAAAGRTRILHGRRPDCALERGRAVLISRLTIFPAATLRRFNAAGGKGVEAKRDFEWQNFSRGGRAGLRLGERRTCARQPREG